MDAKTEIDSTHLFWLRILQQQVAGIRFGTVQLTVHNGEVVQIERTEKTRIENTRSLSSPVAGSGR